MKKVVFSILMLSFYVLSNGCSSIDKIDASTPEGAFKLAEAYEKDERYDEAVTRYQEVRTKYPYSKLATESELRIADVNFKRESFIEAAGSYQLFKDFHPKHQQIDYVTFRLGLSYFNQLPPTIDRDLSVADKAILYFDETMNSYPNSQYVNEAKQKKEAAQKMLAQKELYVADFYYKRDIYDSALARYEFLMKTYPNLGFEPKALYGAARSANRVGGEKDRALQYYKRLASLYPDSGEAKSLKSEFE